MEESLQANRKETRSDQRARRTKEGKRIENRITRIRACLRAGRKRKGKGRKEGAFLTREEREQKIKELKMLETERRKTPSLKIRPKIGYTRYADDYLVSLQQHSKAEAERVKEKIGIFLKTHLGLEQSEEKTLITHPTNVVNFLGFELKSNGGRRKGLKLEIPKKAKEKLLQEVERLGLLHHIDEADLILKVNEKVRGWMNYYRYASAPQRTFSEMLHKVFWQVSHYLAAKHEISIPQMLKKYRVKPEGKTRKTLRMWVKGKTIDLWLFPPKTGRIHDIKVGQPAIDEVPKTIHEWAKGRSIEKRIEALEEADYKCRECGETVTLKVHHKGGLKGYRQPKSLAEAGRTKARRVLCDKCHLEAHGGSFAPRTRGHKTA